MSQQDASHRVFISYSHDSEQHKARVRALSERLRSEGVDCWIDRYVPNPSEGWPNWMRFQIREATYVLVVCTEPYLRRVDLSEQPGRGRGATWEGGLITLEVYAAQGRNDKFIPVVFSTDDSQYIPDYLQGVTWYNLERDGDYDQLYARLTQQEIEPVPPLGRKRMIGSIGPAIAESSAQADVLSPPSDVRPPADLHSLVLLQHGEATFFLHSTKIQERGDRVDIKLAPRDAHDSAFLAGLKSPWGRTDVALAYGNVAHLATVDDVSVEHENGTEQWHLSIQISQSDYGAANEMATTGFSADRIAELRARRILLDERPPEEQNRWARPDEMLEALVQGVSSPAKIEHSPLPKLFREGGRDGNLFLAMARLVAVLHLRLSGTVEHVLELEMSFEGPNALSIHFLGRRRKFYTNLPAPEIRVDGTCPL